jgi:hypothetical protein
MYVLAFCLFCLKDLENEQDGNDEFDSDWSDDYGSEDEGNELDFQYAIEELESIAPAPGPAVIGSRVPTRKISQEQREIIRIMAAMDKELKSAVDGRGNILGGQSFVRREAKT